MGLATGNQRDIRRHNVEAAIQKFKLHDSDRGSTALQGTVLLIHSHFTIVLTLVHRRRHFPVAVLTEKIKNLARHMAANKNDKHNKRQFEILVGRRRKLLVYLKRYDFARYNEVLAELGLN
jgi:ribosomal protein S15